LRRVNEKWRKRYVQSAEGKPYENILGGRKNLFGIAIIAE